MNFFLGLLTGLAAGVVSYLLFVSSSRKSVVVTPVVPTETDESKEEVNVEWLVLIRDAVNSLSVGVVVIGTDGKVIFRNKLAESVT